MLSDENKQPAPRILTPAETSLLDCLKHGEAKACTIEYISKSSALALSQFLPRDESPVFGQWYYDLDLSDTAPAMMYISKNHVYFGGTMTTYFPTPSRRVRAYTTAELLDFLPLVSTTRHDVRQVTVKALGITKTAETLPEAMVAVVIEYYTRVGVAAK